MRCKEVAIKIIPFLSENKKDSVVPAYGHGQVYSYPDIPYLEWRYEYDATDNFTSHYRVSRVIGINIIREFSGIKNYFLMQQRLMV